MRQLGLGLPRFEEEALRFEEWLRELLHGGQTDLRERGREREGERAVGREGGR